MRVLPGWFRLKLSQNNEISVFKGNLSGADGRRRLGVVGSLVARVSFGADDPRFLQRCVQKRHMAASKLLHSGDVCLSAARVSIAPIPAQMCLSGCDGLQARTQKKHARGSAHKFFGGPTIRRSFRLSEVSFKYRGELSWQAEIGTTDVYTEIDCLRARVTLSVYIVRS